MPSWNAVLDELNLNTIDGLRKKYLALLAKKTGRNVIAYYSGWLSNPNANGVDINDMDMNSFMTTIHGLDCSKGLDLILHTPGGGISATEQIVYYLKSKFNNDIRAFIPQVAMSAGTMIACACSCIFMGKQSALGPIDPQFRGVSARGVYEEFQKAIEEIKNDPSSIPMWQVIIGKYHPTMIDNCVKAWARSQDMVSKWLTEGMFKATKTSKTKTGKIVAKLSGMGHNLGHDKHISIGDARDAGLNIIALEDDQQLQDLTLTVHHCFMHTFSMAHNATKIIENHSGVGVVNWARSPQ